MINTVNRTLALVFQSLRTTEHVKGSPTVPSALLSAPLTASLHTHTFTGLSRDLDLIAEGLFK